MKISIIAAPFVEVPPQVYGGHERVIHSLSKELSSNGNEVTLFASGDSKINVPLQKICDRALFNDVYYDHSTDRNFRLKEINKKTISLIDKSTEIINCHDYDNPDLIDRLSRLEIPVLVSIGHSINGVIQDIYDKHKDSFFIHFNGLSKSQLKSLRGGENIPVIYNGIPISIEQIRTPKNMFLSLGDTKPIKGHRTAIELAKKSELELIIAGSPVYPESKDYFESSIKPFIDLDYSSHKSEFLLSLDNGYVSHGGRIIYIGSVNDAEKDILFRNVLFTQFLGSLDITGNIEACPLVPLESTLHGVPVLGVKGSVTDELIVPGINGYNVDSLFEATRRIGDLSNLDSNSIRSFGIRTFSENSMAQNYLELYKKIILENEKS